MLCMKVETRERKNHNVTESRHEQKQNQKKSQLSIHIVADLMLQLIKIEYGMRVCVYVCVRKGKQSNFGGKAK